jgi:tellurium resistance protein TerD
MSVTLTKGGNVSLSKEAPNLTAVTVGLGWDVRVTTGANFDLDASALACGENKRVLSDLHFVFYNNPRSPDGSIECGPDNQDGSGDGDDEFIEVNLSAVPPNIASIVFPVSIHEADARGQTFGQVQNAYIRVVDASNGSELARYDLSEDASTETAMVFGELYRRDGEWKFRAVGQGYASGLGGIARDYGVSVG